MELGLFANANAAQMGQMMPNYAGGPMAKTEDFTGEAFEAFGEWSLAHNSDHTFVGTLKFDPESGLDLRLLDPTGRDGFAGLAGAAGTAGAAAFGRTHSHGAISLFSGFVRSKPMSSHGPAESHYFFNRGLLGVGAVNGPDRLLSGIHATSDLLRVWIDAKIVDQTPLQPGRTITISHTLPDPILFPIDANSSLEIAWDRKGPAWSLAQSDIALTSRPWIGVKYTSPATLKAAVDDLGLATRIVSLTAGFELHPDLYDCRLADADDAGNQRAFLLQHSRRRRNTEDDRIPMDLVFTFPAVQTRYPQMLLKWFDLCRKVPAVINTFFSANYSAFTNQKLFALATVIEALHRYLSGVQMSFRQRLQAVFSTFPQLIPEVLGPDVAGFENKIVESRNIEAHCDESGSRSDGSEHVRLFAKLRVLIDAMLMKEIGIDESEMLRAMKNSNEYWFYASHAEWAWDG